MNSKPDNQTKILNHLGISKELICLPSSSTFLRYVTNEYRNSSRKDTDEVYGMSEINLIHNISGIRLTLTSREDYLGDVVYKVIHIFIITTAKTELDILDIDFENKIFHTPEGEIPFSMAITEI